MTTTLKCPKCKHGMPEHALDVGQCPACGFPLDGPLAFDGPARRSMPALYLLGAGVLAGVGAAGYALFEGGERPPVRVADATPADAPPGPAVHVAPPPHAPKPRDPQASTEPAAPNPADQPPPVAVDPPKPDGPRPVGVVMRVDPKIAPVRHFDQPDDEARLPDLNSGDKVVLTGKLRRLRIGSVNGKGSIDASDLVVEEVVVTGDLNGDAVVHLNAPRGKVTVGGYVGGTSRLIVAAPDGEVVVSASAGRVTGSAAVTVTAKKVDVAGKMLGGSRLNVTFTSGGSLKLASVEEGAVVTYRRSAAADPAVAVEKGAVRGGAKVIAE